MRRVCRNDRLVALLMLTTVAGCDLFAKEQSSEPGAYQGVIELDEHLLSFETGGRITAVKVERGAPVDAGALVATLDDTLEKTRRDALRLEVEAAQSQVELLRAGAQVSGVRALEAQVRAARANQERLQANLQREQELLRRGVSTKERTDNLRFQVANASASRQSLVQQLKLMRAGARAEEIAGAEARSQALALQVEMQEERIRRLALNSAVAGTVLDVHLEAGEMAMPGAPVVTIGDTSHPFADVFVPQADVAGIQVSAPAVIRVDSLEQTLTGRVEHISRRTEFTPRYIFSESDRSALVVRVRVRIEDPEGLLHAGVPAFVTIQPGSRTQS